MMKKRIPGPVRWIIGLAVLYVFGVIAAIVWQVKHIPPAVVTERDMIRAIIENLPDYREEIESWGYQVYILPQDAETVGYREYDSLQFYFEPTDRVLILTDADGGMYCFDYGFDRYVLKTASSDRVQKQYGDEYIDAVRIVELSIAKRMQNQAPYRENTNKEGTSAYYDMSVGVNIGFFSVEDGRWLDWGGWYYTYYCSNNFVDCRWFGQSLHHSAESINESADMRIKQEYSAAQLMEWYQKGLELQKRLTELYHQASAAAVK